MYFSSYTNLERKGYKPKYIDSHFVTKKKNIFIRNYVNTIHSKSCQACIFQKELWVEIEAEKGFLKKQMYFDFHSTSSTIPLACISF